MVPKGKAHLHDYVVVDNEGVAEGVQRLVMRAPALAAELMGGQFVNVAVPGDPSHLLRIPLAFSAADAAAGTVELEFAVVGEGTRRLAAMAPDQGATVVGPCGNPWRVGEGQGRSVLVCGGIGVTPIVACARMLVAAGVAFDAVVGAGTAAKLWGTDELEALGAGRVVVTTDDGTAGRKGFTTDALADLLASGSYGMVYTCGPEVMMRGVARLCAEAGVACQVSMERMMTCGFGACNTCNVPAAKGGYLSVCMDGPVFDAEEVAW